MRRRLSGLLIAVALLAVGGLPSTARGDGCVPGEQIACGCAGGESGLQVCAEDGGRFGPCVQCRPVTASAPPPVVAVPPAPPAPETRRSVPLMVTGIAALGAGAVLATIGGVLLGLKASRERSLEEQCGPDRVCPAGAARADLEAARAQGSTAAVMFGVAVPLAVAGAIMLPIGAWKVRADVATAPSIEPVIGAGRGGVRLRF